MTRKLIEDNSGHTLKVVEYGKRLFTTHLLKHGQDSFNFQARPDDIIICAYPKAGTHWTSEVIRFLLAETTDLPVTEKEINMIDFYPISTMEALPSPRHVCTHYHFDNLSPDILRQKSKIVHLIRDPRDIAVSYFVHQQGGITQYKGEWKDYFQLYLGGQVIYNSWFEYTKGWEQGMKEHADHPFLVIVYESMKKDPLKEVTRLADFLGLNRSDDFLKEVVEKTSFDSMKSKRNNDNGRFYRKGVTGDWKNWFTVSQSEQFNQVFEKEMVGTDAYTLYSHRV